MREGLSSGRILLEETEVVLVESAAEKELEGNKQKECNSNKEVGQLSEPVDEVLVSALDEEVHISKGHELQCNGCVCNADERKRRWIVKAGDDDCGGAKKKVVKEEVVDGELQVVARVLRSRIVMKSEGGKEDQGRKSGVGMVGKEIGGNEESANRRVEVKEEVSEFVDVPEVGLVVDELRLTMKRKRGRPRKIHEANEERVELKMEENAYLDWEWCVNMDNNAVKKFKGKCARSPKVRESGGVDRNMLEQKRDGNEDDVCFVREVNLNRESKAKKKLKRKHGISPRALKGDRFHCNWADEKSTGDEGKGYKSRLRKQMKRKRGRPPKLNNEEKMGSQIIKGKRTELRYNVSHKLGNSISFSRKGFNGEVSEVKKLGPGKMIKWSADEKEVSKNACKLGEMNQSKRQLAREKIVKLILDAGWTIDYRPRAGKDYKDSVYVSPEGRAYWSVTLAYQVLKQHYDDGGVNAATCTAGFKFAPVPDEEFYLLTKVMGNKKKPKWKQAEKRKELPRDGTKKKWDWKLNKKKVKKAASVKALRGRMKAESSMSEQRVIQLEKGTAMSVKNRKWLKTDDRKRCALVVRNSKSCTDSEGDGYILYNGKRSVLGWMIDLGTVPCNGRVQYLKRRKTEALFEGTITADGIHCNCCDKILDVSVFESHAGGKSPNPSANIYLESGNSLLQCQLDSWNKHDEVACKGFHFVDISGEDPNDDTCGICGDGGDLICCDSCPSTFHQSCLDINNFPSGVWHCLYCSCRFCGTVDRDVCHMGDNDDHAAPTLLTCYLCQEKYHKTCSDATTGNPSSPSYCGKKCCELHERLQKLLGVKHELQDGFSWTLIQQCDVGSDISVNGMPLKVECNSRLAVAMHVMDECFSPMIDQRSGVNLIRNIVYNFGSNLFRLNYSHFLTAILEKGEEMVATASIRIHGNRLAEMPFIGTRYVYRRQGMCRRLLSGIESALSSLKVEKLVIPAISELRETWTSVFGFETVDKLSKQRMKSISMVMFPGVDILQKPLLNYQLAEDNLTFIEGLSSTKLLEPRAVDETMDGLKNEYHLRSASRCGEIDAQYMQRENAAEGCALPVLHGCLAEKPVVTCADNLRASPNNTEFPDALVAGSGSSERKNKADGSPLDLYSGAYEQTRAIFEHQNHSDTSAVPVSGEAMLELDVNLNPHKLSQMESKLPEISFIGSKVEVSDNLQGRNKSDTILNSLVSTHKQTEEIFEDQNQCSSSAVPLSGEMIVESNIQLNLQKLCKVESKLSEVSLITVPITDSLERRIKSDASALNSLSGSHEQTGNQNQFCSSAVPLSGETVLESDLNFKRHGLSQVDKGLFVFSSNGFKAAICDNAGKRNKSNGHPTSLFGANDQTGDVLEDQDKYATTAVPLSGESMIESAVNLQKLTEVEEKLFEISHLGLKVSYCGVKSPLASKEISRIDSGDKFGDKDGEHDGNYLDEGHMPVTAEFLTAQQLTPEHETPSSDAVRLESDSMTCLIGQSISLTSEQRAQDHLNVQYTSSPLHNNVSSSVPGDVDDQDVKNSLAIADLNMKSKVLTSTSNVSCMAAEVGSVACDTNNVDSCYDESKRSTLAQSDGSLDRGVISDEPQVNLESSKHPGWGSDVDLTTMTQSKSESLCNSSSTHGITLHCISAAGSSCGAPEIVVLSNQAS